MALTQDNELFAFGANQQGECGTGGMTDINSPKQIEMPGRRKKLDPFGEQKVAIDELTKP